MDEQKSQLVFCDLSHTFAGILLPAIEQFWKIDLSFPQAVEKALAWAGEGAQTTLVFISLPGDRSAAQKPTDEEPGKDH